MFFFFMIINKKKQGVRKLIPCFHGKNIIHLPEVQNGNRSCIQQDQVIDGIPSRNTSHFVHIPGRHVQFQYILFALFLLFPQSND